MRYTSLPTCLIPPATRLRGARWLCGFSTVLLIATADAGTYPATGTQNFTYANGSVPGQGSWNDGSALSSSLHGEPPAPVASVQGNALRLTADGVFNTTSSFKLPDVDPGRDISAFTLAFTLKLAATGTPGHGFTVAFGQIPPEDGDGEAGFGVPGGLEISWDTFVDTANGETQGEIVVYANRERVAAFPQTFSHDGVFRTVSVQWGASGLTLNWNNTTLATNLPVPGFVPTVGSRLGFTARTGETAAQEIAIDALRLTTTPAASIATGGPIISEFVADNNDSYEDEDVEASDWLELYNGSGASVAMEGWHLTDDPANLTKWTLPAFNLTANGYRVIFASGKDRRTASGALHTNFSLGKNSGYLALVRPDLTIASEYHYGPQVEDIAYGEVGASRQRGYLETPTPGEKNVSLVSDGPPTEEVVFSRPGGLLASNAPVTLAITPPTAPGAVVRYSLTQAIPTELSPVYEGPFEITNTTTVRARVFEPGKLPGPVSSRTFLKLDASLTNYNGSGQVFSSNLPVIVMDSHGVNVDGTTDPGSARPFRPTYAVVLSPDNPTGRASLADTPDYTGRSGTHVRGESSSGFAQKSYAWETWNNRDQDKDEAFLGFPAESDWVLHGPFSDKTLMRNYLVYSTFQDTRADWFSPRTRFVELFFNQQPNQPVSFSDYKGVYLLVEKIKRTRNRANVAKLSPLTSAQPMVTGGYIFKKDKASLGSTKWTSSRGVELQSSTPDTLSSAQLSYLRGYVNSFESALHGSSFTSPTTGYARWIDVGSFIDWQWAVEIPKQIDGYVFSTYFMKDRGGLMRAGPLWDFNISFGNADYAEGEYSTGWNYDATRKAALSGSLWFPRLHADPNYRMATFDRYWELRRGHWSNEALHTRIDAASALLRDGIETPITNNTANSVQSPIARHFRKHKILGQRHWPNPASATQRTTFQAEIAALKTWIDERMAWMDNQFLFGQAAMRPPVMERTALPDGSAQITLTPFGGTEAGYHFPDGIIYYTTDGSDPRPANTALPTTQATTVLAEYGTASWLVPTADNGGRTLALADWTGRPAPPNADAWSTGQLGVGFDAQPSSSTNPIKYHLAGSHSGDTTWDGGSSNLQAAMMGQSSTVFVRVPFTLTEDQAARLVTLQLKMRYDDGFIAFINGVEVARQNVTPTLVPTWDAVADDIPSNFTDARGVTTGVTLEISHAIQHVQAGENILAILALNKSADDDDLLCSPSLLGRLGVKPAAAQPPITATAYTAPLTVSSSTLVKARLYAPATGLWSPLSTSNLIVGAEPASKDNLVISEIHYAPLPPTTEELAAGAVEASDFEFIELLNIGTKPVDLSGVKLTGAVQDFDFSLGSPTALTLPPGGRVLVTGSLAAFQARYGNASTFRIAGEFIGNLNNSGETVTLLDKTGAVIWSFAYSNQSPWPTLTEGRSLVLASTPEIPAPDPTNGANWRAGRVDGTPGEAESEGGGFTLVPGDDDDGDGVNNLLEHALGTDPLDRTSVLTPLVLGPGAAPGLVQLEHPREAVASGYELALESSPDLKTWSRTPSGLTPLGTRTDESNRVWTQWQVEAAPGVPLFFRLVVEQP